MPVPSTSEQKIDMEKKRGLMAFMGSIKAVTGVTRGNWHWQCQVKTSGPCCCSSRLWLVAVLAILHDVLELSFSSYSLHAPASIDALSGCRNSNWSIPYGQKWCALTRITFCLTQSQPHYRRPGKVFRPRCDPRLGRRDVAKTRIFCRTGIDLWKSNLL